MNYDIDAPGDLQVDEEALRQYNTVGQIQQEIQQEQADQAKAKAEEERKKKELDAKLNPDGTPKTPYETMDPKQFGLTENAKELGNAVVGAGVDIINSVGSIPKFFDSNFYKEDSGNPYEFKAPWLIKDKPITRTVWGNVIENVLEFGGGAIGAGKVGWALKGVKGVQAAAKAGGIASVASMVATKAPVAAKITGAALSGAAYDLISNDSQQSNVSAAILKVKPEWSHILKPISTTEFMSPAQRAVYNMFEGMGLGVALDLGLSAAGAAYRGLTGASKAAKARVTDPLQSTIGKNQVLDAVDTAERLNYDRQGTIVKAEARASYERATYDQAMTDGRLGEVPPTFDEWKRKVNKNGNNPWNKLTKEEQDAQAKAWAGMNEVDWGDRDFSLRAKNQTDAEIEVAEDQLFKDLDDGAPRQNAAYMEGGDVTDNRALTHSTDAAKGMRDQIRIRQDRTQMDGSPRGPLTEAHIRRMENGHGFMSTDEADRLAEFFVTDETFQALYGGPVVKEQVKQNFLDMADDIRSFLDDSGHSRIIDASEEELYSFVESLRQPSDTGRYGSDVLNTAQLTAVDLMVGQLARGARDLSRAAVNISDQVDVSAAGSLTDGIFARMKSLAKLRKQTSVLSSWNLSRFTPGEEDLGRLDELVEAEGEVIDNLRNIIRADTDGELIDTYLHWMATGGQKPQTFKDFQEFMKRKLHGYSEGNIQYRNKIVGELQSMGINSILSGPKTPVRAAIGTGLGTIMRPVAAMIGTIGSDNPTLMRSNFAAFGGMVEGMGDAWRAALADFKTYTQRPDGWRGATVNTKDYEWEALKSFTNQYGSDGDKAAMAIADSMRYINKLPVFNYSPRIMAATDTFFSQLIGRSRQHQLAYLDAYEKASVNGIVSDLDFDRIFKQSKIEFENKVFSADGQITDEMAQFWADEAKLTKELTGFGAAFEKAFDKAPYLKPFVLFMKTGKNALEMSAKYTPLLNSFLKESQVIMNKNIGDPELLQYGIKSQDDLEIARAVHKGRTAIGFSVISMAGMMALNGNLTGNGPPDKQLRESMKQFGWKPRSVRIGGNYVSYEPLEPFNSLLSMVADIADGQKVMGDEWVGNWYAKLGYYLAQNVTNKTVFAGLFQLQDILQSNGQRLEAFAGNFVNNQIPLAGMRNELGKLLSPGQRELESGFLESIRNRNLWTDLTGDGGRLPYRYDILNGQPLNDHIPIVRLNNAINPFMINPGTNPTRELLFRSGVDLKLTFNTGPNNESLEGNPELKSKWQYYIGKQNVEGQLTELFKDRQVVQSIIDMEEDRAANRVYEADETFHVPLIERVLKDAKQTAWQQMMNDSPDVQELNQKATLEALSGKLRKQGKREQANDIEQILAVPH